MKTRKERKMINLDDFHDDPLHDLLNQGAAAEPAVRRPAPQLPPSYKPSFTEPCRKCGGSGRFVSASSGRVFGPCFACGGKGKKTFATSPEQRAKARASAGARRAKVQAEKREATKAWLDEHKAEVEWLHATANREENKMGLPPFKYWEFPVKLRESLAQYGTLTDGQLAAVRKCMLRDVERKAERQAKAEQAPTVDVSKIEQAFAVARSKAAAGGDSVRWLNLRLDTFRFDDAPASGQWPAAIFVKEGDAKLGRIVGGKFVRSRVCTDEQEQRIVAAIADPAQAARAYGLRFKQCSVCGRELTNEESRGRGIGPICAERFGW
jgi:hypothetical protein